MVEDKVKQELTEEIADILYWGARKRRELGGYQTKEFGLSKCERQVLYKEEIDQILAKAEFLIQPPKPWG